MTAGVPSAPIVFDIFVDLMCSDCKADWKITEAVAAHYG
jgi:protein-disulfide isomerase